MATAALGIVAVLMGALAITAAVSRKAGETRTKFLVGREIHEGKNVAVLFSDGYGGLVTREADLSSHTMLPTVFLVARWDSLPVLQVMSLKRNRLR